jgi:hypothetical protein
MIKSIVGIKNSYNVEIQLNKKSSNITEKGFKTIVEKQNAISY